MPYFLVGNCVHKGTKGNDGGVVPGGCHKTHAQAVDHLRALMANVKGAAPLPVVAPTTPDVHQSPKAPVRFYFQEGDRAPDGRIIDSGATNFNRPPPLPIRLQTVQGGGGHEGAIICGAVTNVARFGNVVVGDGFLDLSQSAGQQALTLATNGTLQTWSPDMGDAKITAQILPGGPDVPENPDDQPDTHFTACTLLGFTIVAVPALGSAVFEILDDAGNVVVPAPSRGASFTVNEEAWRLERGFSEDDAPSIEEVTVEYLDDYSSTQYPTALRKKLAKTGEAMPDGSYPIRNKKGLMDARRSVGRANPADRPAVKAHIRKRAKALGVKLPPNFSGPSRTNIAACAGPESPPAEWFSDPQLTELQQFITITDEGRVFGHLAAWETCHISYLGKNVCVTPPDDDDFSYFRHGQVMTEDGTFVATGPIALKGGHAGEQLSAKGAQAHYDDPNSAVMDVAVGNDDIGIWFSGALRQGVTENDVARIRASGVSGDWRMIDGQLRLVGICSVNVPGFPKVRLAASGAVDDDDEEPTIEAIIGMGTDPDFNEECEDCQMSLEEELASLREEVTYLRELVTAAGLEDTVLERLAASIE